MAPFAAFLAAAPEDRLARRRRAVAAIGTVLVHGLVFAALQAAPAGAKPPPQQPEKPLAPRVRLSLNERPAPVPPPPAVSAPPRPAITRPKPARAPQLANDIPAVTPAPEAPAPVIALPLEAASLAQAAAPQIEAPAAAPATASSDIAAVTAPVAANPVPTLGIDRRALLDRYLHELLGRRINERRFYPPEAEEAGLEAVIVLKVVMTSAGRLVSVKVMRGNEIPLLARAAIETVRAASPFPTPPSGLGDPIEVEVAVNYRLGG